MWVWPLSSGLLGTKLGPLSRAGFKTVGNMLSLQRGLCFERFEHQFWYVKIDDLTRVVRERERVPTCSTHHSLSILEPLVDWAFLDRHACFRVMEWSHGAPSPRTPFRTAYIGVVQKESLYGM